MGLFNRLSIALIGLAVATAGAVVFVVSHAAEQAMLAQGLEQLDRHAAILSRQLESCLAEGTFGGRDAIPDLRSLVSGLRQAGTNAERVDVIDPRGRYLVPPESASAPRLQDEFPSLIDVLGGDHVPPRVVSDHAGARYGVASARLQVPGGQRLNVLVTAPYAVLVAPAASVWQRGLIVGAAAVLAAALIAFFFGRSLRRPILQMTAAVEAFGRGAAPAIPVNAGGEIGMLARAFSRLAELLDEKSEAARRSSELLDKDPREHVGRRPRARSHRPYAVRQPGLCGAVRRAP